MSNETASFTLEFRDKVSGPASRARDTLAGVKAGLHGVGAAAEDAERRAGHAAGGFETAAQKMARGRDARGRFLPGQGAKSSTDDYIRGQREAAKTVGGVQVDALQKLDDAMAHQSWVHQKRQELSAQKIAHYGQKMDDAMAHERWVAAKRSQAKIEKFERAKARSATGGLGLDLGAAASGAGMVVGGLVAIAAAAATAAAAVGYVGVKFLEAGVEGLKFGQTAELALGNLLHNGENAREQFDEVRHMAQRLGLGVEETVGSFQKLLAAQFEVGKAKELIRMGADLQGIGASADEVGRALLAITQIKSKGRLMAQEMLQLQEAGISSELVYAALGKRLGKTRDELAQLQEAGKIDAGTGLEAILEAVRVKTGTKQAGELGEKFAKTTLAGMAGAAGAGLSNFFVDVGRQLEPIIMPIAQRLIGVFDRVKNDPVIRGIGQSLLASLQNFGNWVLTNWPAIESAIITGVQYIGRAFQFGADVAGFLAEHWGIIKTVGYGVGIVLGIVAAAAITIMAPLYLAIGLVAGLVGAIAYAISWVAGNIGSWVTAGSDMIMGMATGVGNAALYLIDAVKSAVSGAIDAAKSFLGIASPSKLFEGFGEMTVQGYVAGVKNTAGQAGAATTSMASQAAEPVGFLASTVGMSFVGPAPTTAANDGTPPRVEGVAPVRVREPGVDSVASAGTSGRVVNFNFTANVAAGPGANQEDADRLAELLRPKMRQVAMDVLEEAAS